MKSKQQIAVHLTLFCFALSLIGILLATIIGIKGGPEALGMIIPLIFTGVLNISLGPIVIYHAYKYTSLVKSMFIFGYFFLFNIFILIISEGQALLYTFAFIVLTLSPFVYSLGSCIIKQLFKKNN